MLIPLCASGEAELPPLVKPVHHTLTAASLGNETWRSAAVAQKMIQDLNSTDGEVREATEGVDCPVDTQLTEVFLHLHWLIGSS